ncbi:MAG: hypothetical protein HUU57_11765 [Bdellovibrio sp.]|nr:hypothetical protein [Bdellovibrio sp.]
MSWLKYLPLVACLWVQTAFAANPVAPVKSYREWKTERVVLAEGKITSLKLQITTKKMARVAAPGVDPNLAQKAGPEASLVQDKYVVEKLERQLHEEQYALELAKDLSVTDYFVGYLTKIQDKKSAFNEVAGKLSPDEVAELMTAYANSVFGAQAGDLPASATNVGKDAGK